MSIPAEGSQVVPIQNANVDVTRGDVLQLGKTITSESTVLSGDSNGYRAGPETGQALTSSLGPLAIPYPTLPQATQIFLRPCSQVSIPSGKTSMERMPGLRTAHILNITAQPLKIPHVRLPNGSQAPKTPGSQIYLPSHVILPRHIPGVRTVRLLRNATTPSTVVPNSLPSQGAQVLQTSCQQMPFTLPVQPTLEHTLQQDPSDRSKCNVAQAAPAPVNLSYQSAMPPIEEETRVITGGTFTTTSIKNGQISQVSQIRVESVGAVLARKDGGNCYSVLRSSRLQSNAKTTTSANEQILEASLTRNSYLRSPKHYMRDIHNFLDQKYPNDVVIPSAIINVLIDTEDVFIRYKNEYIAKGKSKAAIVRQIYSARLTRSARIANNSGNLTSKNSKANITSHGSRKGGKIKNSTAEMLSEVRSKLQESMNEIGESGTLTTDLQKRIRSAVQDTQTVFDKNYPNDPKTKNSLPCLQGDACTPTNKESEEDIGCNQNLTCKNEDVIDNLSLSNLKKESELGIFSTQMTKSEDIFEETEDWDNSNEFENDTCNDTGSKALVELFQNVCIEKDWNVQTMSIHEMNIAINLVYARSCDSISEPEIRKLMEWIDMIRPGTSSNDIIARSLNIIITRMQSNSLNKRNETDSKSDLKEDYVTSQGGEDSNDSTDKSLDNNNKDEYSRGRFLGGCGSTINESSTPGAEISEVDFSPWNEGIDDTVENLSCSGHRTYLSSYSTETERSHETNNTETLSQSLGSEDSSSPTELNTNRSLVREEVVLSKNATAASLEDLSNTNQGRLKDTDFDPIINLARNAKNTYERENVSEQNGIEIEEFDDGSVPMITNIFSSAREFQNESNLGEEPVENEDNWKSGLGKTEETEDELLPNFCGNGIMYDRLKLQPRITSVKARKKLLANPQSRLDYLLQGDISLKRASIKIKKGAIYPVMNSETQPLREFTNIIENGVVHLKNISDPPNGKQKRKAINIEKKCNVIKDEWFCLDCECCSQLDCQHTEHPRYLINGNLNAHFDITGHSWAQPVNNFVRTSGICNIRDIELGTSKLNIKSYKELKKLLVIMKTSKTISSSISNNFL